MLLLPPFPIQTSYFSERISQTERHYTELIVTIPGPKGSDGDVFLPNTELGELPPPPAASDTSSDSEPEVEAEDEDGDEATMFDRANTEYSTLKRLGEMDRYLCGISTERRNEAREHHKLKQSVSTLEGQMRGLMLEDKEEKERLKKAKGAIKLCRWFEMSEMVFSISDCAKRNKVKFTAATLQVATLGLNVAIGKSWGDMKKMMLEEFCPNEEVQRMEDKLRSLKLRDTNIAAYTQRFHKLVLLCPEAVPTEKKKVEAYIK
nr:hypothetical protein [Tanacetum cinerariifolium]